jgi:hypothetical protein
MPANVFPENMYSNEVLFGQVAGSSKRELFAAMAMQGLLSNSNIDAGLPDVIEDAVDAADILIKRLKDS